MKDIEQPTEPTLPASLPAEGMNPRERRVPRKLYGFRVRSSLRAGAGKGDVC